MWKLCVQQSLCRQLYLEQLYDKCPWPGLIKSKAATAGLVFC